jgi:hypothetical protein
MSASRPAEALRDLFIPIFLAVIEQALDALPYLPGYSEEQKKIRRDVGRLLINALCPEDPDQAAAAAQIVVLHFMAMECFRRAAQPDLADRQMLQFLGKANALLRQHIRLLTDYRKRQTRAPVQPDRDAAPADATPAHQFNPMPSENDTASPDADPAPRLHLSFHDTALDPAAAKDLHTQTTGMQKVLRQMAANGVSKGFRPGKLRELAARAAR